MNEIIISSEKEGFTNISNNFIEFYMTDANGDFVKLYLYLAMLCSTGRRISISDIADQLNCTEKDVCRGIKYWIKSDVLSLTYNDEKEVTGIILKSLKRPADDLITELKVVDFKFSQATKPAKNTAQDSTEVSESNVETEEIKAPRKKQPTPDELNNKLQDKELANLISEATAYCNRDLAQKELSSLIYIKDQLGFSFDLCEYLLEYCAGVKKTSFNYIEKVARNWYEEGITNRDDAAEYTERYMTLYSKIMKTLGITNRFSPAPVEKKLIDTWTRDYDFSDSIILEACNRTVLQVPNDPSFQYANGILKRWHEKNIHTLSDISELDNDHTKRKTAASNATITKTSNDESLNQLKQIESIYLKKGTN